MYVSSPYVRSGKTKSVPRFVRSGFWTFQERTIVSSLLVRRKEPGPRRVPYYRSRPTAAKLKRGNIRLCAEDD